jgi:hypothetical protein
VYLGDTKLDLYQSTFSQNEKSRKDAFYTSQLKMDPGIIRTDGTGSRHKIAAASPRIDDTRETYAEVNFSSLFHNSLPEIMADVPSSASPTTMDEVAATMTSETTEEAKKREKRDKRNKADRERYRPAAHLARLTASFLQLQEQRMTSALKPNL